MMADHAPIPNRNRGRLALATDWLLLLGVFLALVATGVAFFGHFHWFADLFAHFRPQYVMWFALAGVILLLRRKWTLAAMATAGLVTNFAVMWPHAAQSAISASPNAAKVRVVSFNLYRSNSDMPAVERFLRECDADVVVFQEITPASAQAIRNVKSIYPGQLIRGRKYNRGTAIITRLPVKNLRFAPTPGQEAIGAVVGELEGPAGPFTVFGIHSRTPTSPSGAGSQEIYFRWLAQQVTQVRETKTPVIITGDFNSTPWSQGFQRFTAACPPLIDTSRGILFGATWNVALPQRLLIDHAFVSPEWQLINREVGPDAGSDHRPLIVDLGLLK